MELSIPQESLDLVRPMFVDVEGHCEVWTDEEIARRMFIRGAMEYAKSLGKSWDDVQAVATTLRSHLRG